MLWLVIQRYNYDEASDAADELIISAKLKTIIKKSFCEILSFFVIVIGVKSDQTQRFEFSDAYPNQKRDSFLGVTNNTKKDYFCYTTLLFLTLLLSSI